MFVLRLDDPFPLSFRPEHTLAMRAPTRGCDWQLDGGNGPPLMDPRVTDCASGAPADDLRPEDDASANRKRVRTASKLSIDDIRPYSGVVDGER